MIQPRHVVILAHPDTDSFNAAIAEHYCATVRECGHTAELRDLYRIGFDPVLKDHERPGRSAFRLAPDVRTELDIIDGADVYALVYPVWFGMPPAILKGYIDRVFGAGVTAREIQERSGQGVLRNSRLFSITTSGARGAWLDEQGQIDSLKNVMSRYLTRAFGIRKAEHLQFGGITEGLAKRFVDEHLLDVRERVRRLCAEVSAGRHHAAAA